MNSRKMILILLLLFICDLSFSQSNQWFKYTTSNSILPTNQIDKMLKDKNGIIWLGTSEGLVRIDPWNEWQVFNSSNSGLPYDNTKNISLDKFNNVWVATPYYAPPYFAKYDGSHWSIVDLGQTCFSRIFAFAVYSNGIKWITETPTEGIILYLDSTICQLFTPGEIGIDPTYDGVMLIDDNDIFWCAGEPHPYYSCGMAKTDGTTWITKDNTFNFSIDTINNLVWGITFNAIEKINIQNLQLIQKYVYPDGADGSYSIFVDNQGNVWTSTPLNNPNIPRLYKFEPDSENWKIFNLSEILTGTPSLNSITQDNFGNILLATGGDGLVLFNENGVVTNIEENSHSLPEDFALKQNYPNPFNPSTLIEYSIPYGGLVKLSIYNSLGQTIGVLENEYKPSGNYQIEYNASTLVSGIYFYELRWADKNLIKKMVVIK